MISTRIISIALLYILLLPLLASAQENGWQDLPWGSTQEEVRAVYPDLLVKESVSTYQDPYGIGRENPLQLESYTLAETDMSVDFIFEENRLVGVMLSADGDRLLRFGYGRIINGLMSRYGTPAISEEGRNYKAENIWLLKNTQIKANYIPFDSGEHSIRLGYWMANEEELDKF